MPSNDNQSDDDSYEPDDSILPPPQRRRKVDQAPVTPSIGRQQQSQPVQLLPPPVTTGTSSTITHNYARVHRKRRQTQGATSTSKSTTNTSDWSSPMNCTTNTFPTFTSTSPVGPTILLPLDSLPIDFFHQVFETQLLDHLVEQTNIYANQKNVRDWVDTTPEEMTAFIGFVLGTAIHRLPRLDN